MTSNDFKMTLEWPKNNHVDPKSVFVLWDDILNNWTKYEENCSSKMADILIMPESISKFQLFSLLLINANIAKNIKTGAYSI